MEEKKSSKKRKTEILIVEDSRTQAKQLNDLLEQNEYEAFVTPNGREALTLLGEHKPAIVISDIVMPVMDGYELCTKIKSDENLKDIPVILLTSLTDPEDVIRGLKSGADNFVTKPYSKNFLLSQLRYLLANKELRKTQSSELGITVSFQGQEYLITSNRLQIVDLLLSTFENAVEKNKELIEANKQLLATQNELKTLNEELEEKVEERTWRVKRLNNVLRSIRDVNQLIVRERDRGRLIREACNSLIKASGYHQARIVLLDESGNLVAADEASIDKDSPVLAKQLKHGELTECMKRALAQPHIFTVEGQTSVCNHCPLADTHKKSITMNHRLECSRKVYGILTISVPADYILMKEERSLFKEVSEDIAFALHSIGFEEKHKQSKEALQEAHDGLELKVGKRTRELKDKLSDLQRYQDVTVDRELRMKELRDENKELRNRLKKKE